MAISLEHVDYVYSEGSNNVTYALKDINLNISKGEFIGLIGHTGSGKSTLIQHLNGLIKPTNGVVKFDGLDINDSSFQKINLRRNVGLVFQYPEHQLFEIDVLTDVSFGPKNLGLTCEEAGTRAKAALKKIGMGEEFYKKSPFDLSGGQKRKVAIAGVLAMEPQYLILDEPTAGLDPKGRDELLDCLKDLHTNTGITVVLVSHSMEDVAKYVNRIIVMNRGSKVFDDVPKKIFSYKKELEEMGLAAPSISYIMNDLNMAGMPVKTDAITIEEACNEISKLLQ